jgi:hypothetical protein
MVKPATVLRIGLKLPGVERGTLHGVASLTLKGRLLACPALHRSAEPGSLMVRIPPRERARLIAERPQVFYLTPHYRSYPSILVRLPQIERAELDALLQSALKFVGRKPTRTSRPRRPRNRISRSRALRRRGSSGR